MHEKGPPDQAALEGYKVVLGLLATEGLVAHGELVAALCAAACQYGAAGGGGHVLAVAGGALLYTFHGGRARVRGDSGGGACFKNKQKIERSTIGGPCI